MWGDKGSFVLGEFAYPVFNILIKLLSEQGIDFSTGEGTHIDPKVLCSIGDDYIIADDFEIESDYFDKM